MVKKSTKKNKKSPKISQKIQQQVKIIFGDDVEIRKKRKKKKRRPKKSKMPVSGLLPSNQPIFTPPPPSLLSTSAQAFNLQNQFNDLESRIQNLTTRIKTGMTSSQRPLSAARKEVDRLVAARDEQPVAVPAPVLEPITLPAPAPDVLNVSVEPLRAPELITPSIELAEFEPVIAQIPQLTSGLAQLPSDIAEQEIIEAGEALKTAEQKMQVVSTRDIKNIALTELAQLTPGLSQRVLNPIQAGAEEQKTQETTLELPRDNQPLYKDEAFEARRQELMNITKKSKLTKQPSDFEIELPEPESELRGTSVLLENPEMIIDLPASDQQIPLSIQNIMVDSESESESETPLKPPPPPLPVQLSTDPPPPPPLPVRLSTEPPPPPPRDAGDIPPPPPQQNLIQKTMEKKAAEKAAAEKAAAEKAAARVAFFNYNYNYAQLSDFKREKIKNKYPYLFDDEGQMKDNKILNNIINIDRLKQNPSLALVFDRIQEELLGNINITQLRRETGQSKSKGKFVFL